MILDNGRSKLAGGRYREMLACIRCGACLNVCPVYRKTGGAAYGPVYSGPMGAVLVPLLVGLEQAPGPAARLVALRRLHRRLPGEDPAARAAARAAPRSRRARESRRSASASPSGSGRTRGRRRRATALTTRLARLGGPFAGLAGPGRAWAEGPDAAEARPTLPGPPMSLADEFAANAETAGFVVHRGEAPEIDGAGVSRPSTRSPTRAASCSRRHRRSRAPRSLLPDVHVTLVSEDVILAGPRRAVRRRRRRPAERARDRHRPEPERRHRADSSPSACTARARCTS